MFGNLLIFGGDSKVKFTHSRILARLMLRGKESSLCGKKRGNVTIHNASLVVISRFPDVVDQWTSTLPAGSWGFDPGVQARCKASKILMENI